MDLDEINSQVRSDLLYVAQIKSTCMRDFRNVLFDG